MSPQPAQEIAAGTVVEFFESKEIVCGVCLAAKNQRLNILTEHNREINLAQSRVIHAGGPNLNTRLSRDDLVQKLAAITALRRSLMQQLDIEELWSLVHSEVQGYDARELAEFVFSDALTEHHVSAAQRILLQDHLFFAFKDGKFYAREPEKVEQRRLEIEREKEKEAQVEQGSRWLQTVWNRKPHTTSPEHHEALIEALRSFCLFSQESPHQALVKELFKKANIPPQPHSAFRLMVRLGIWHENENLYLHEQNITPDFPEEVQALADRLAHSDVPAHWDRSRRLDLRALHTFTIDSAQTRDHDDALSLRVLEDGLFEVGIHIADAAEFVSRGDPLDQEAISRASSIYLPDGQISMLPHSLSEGICSLHVGEERLAMSFLLRMNAQGEIQSHEIVPSVITVREQMTYEEVNRRVAHEPFLQTLHELAMKIREQRLARGAIILPLPEIQVHVNVAGMIQVSRHEKETPSQILVSEWMIAANGAAASTLAELGIPAIFRSQAECKPETDFTQSEHPLFHVYRQRRLFARAELDTEPHTHCSLAMPHYTTVTSPLRRCVDLVVQRQLKHALSEGNALYTEEELGQIITRIGAVQSKIFFIQRKWSRYWILKYMEQEDIQSLNALVLDQNNRFAHLLIPDFLIEANVPLTENTRLHRGELVRVKIERINPREDILRVQL